MSTARLLTLAAIAGGTIFLGLPVARIRRLPDSARALLNAASAGILVFLLAEVLTGGAEGVEHALEAANDGAGSWGDFAMKGFVFGLGVAIALLALTYYQRWMERDRATSSAAAASEPQRVGMSAGARLALLIAVGIGFHNFAEGLAIGQSAAKGDVALAALLIVGFALHNATEGFGIVAPMASEPQRPSIGFLALLGLIGGAPTFLGTLVGRSVVNETLSIGFLALAGGSILFVLVQLFNVFRKAPVELVGWGLLAGLVLGYGTDFVLAAGGG